MYGFLSIFNMSWEGMVSSEHNITVFEKHPITEGVERIYPQDEFKKIPVVDLSLLDISSGVPVASICPPASPPLGPRSMM